ncbi:MAG: LysR family transcriptional regulator [Piscinibacter sp.]|nr:LysR family transcriptional regulator [Piscinibacter sp.]
MHRTRFPRPTDPGPGDGPQRVQHLHGWQVFEAAARCRSFARAAEELGITPAAVSQHIKALERHLGTLLFHRTTHAVELTAEALGVYPGIRDGFQSLSTSIARLERREYEHIVRVTAPPAFAARWLLQRIHRFSRRWPRFTPSIDATAALVDFARENVDVGIRYGSGRYDGLESQLLFEEHVFPVCSPALLEAHEQTAPLHVLASLPLIHDATALGTEAPGWSQWLAERGASHPQADRGLTLSSALAIQAAVDGHGVLLGRSVIVADDLAAGRLVRPFAESRKLEAAYYLVVRRHAAQAEKIAAFRTWIHDEVQQSKEAELIPA